MSEQFQLKTRDAVVTKILVLLSFLFFFFCQAAIFLEIGHSLSSSVMLGFIFGGGGQILFLQKMF